MADLNLDRVLANMRAKLLRQETSVKETQAHIAALEKLNTKKGVS